MSKRAFISASVSTLATSALIFARTAEDKRVRLLTLTPAAETLLDELVPGMLRASQRMLAALPAADRVRFMAMLNTLVEAHNEHSRAPSDTA